MDSLETRLGILEEVARDLRSQQGRTASHVDSEQRVRTEQGKRLDVAIRDIERVKGDIDKHDTMLRNTGHGLMFRVAKIEYKAEGNKETFKTWLLVLSLALSLGKIIIDSLHK